MLDKQTASLQTSQKILLVLTLLCLLGVESILIPINFDIIVLFSMQKDWSNENCDPYCSGFDLQTVNCIMMSIGYSIMIFLVIINNEWKRFIVIGNIVLMLTAIIVGAFGLGVTYRFNYNGNDQSFFIFALSHWLLEVGLFLFSLIYEVILYKSSQSTPEKIEKLNTNISSNSPTPPIKNEGQRNGSRFSKN